jgi:hypothetical protein
MVNMDYKRLCDHIETDEGSVPVFTFIDQEKWNRKS